MELFDVLQIILNAACGQDGGYCPAAAATAIGAAFSTIGYWVQSDILDLLTLSHFGHLAIIAYIGAVFVGMIGVATGQPPRNYVWYFLGPAFYIWLLDTRIDVTGVEWRVAGHLQDQKEVWKLAEAGLINTNQFLKMNQMVDSAESPGWTGYANKFRDAGAVVTKDGPPDNTVRVALPFAWYDEVISHTIQWLIKWTGMGWLTNPGNGNINIPADRRNVAERPSDLTYDKQCPSGHCPDANWHLLTNLKWRYLNNITAAKISSPALRDAFVTFTASECGDALFKNLDNARFLAAHHTRGRSVPNTVFQDPEGVELEAGIDEPLMYRDIIQSLMTVTIPMPYTLRELIRTRGKGSFYKSVDWNGNYGKDSDALKKIGLRYKDRIRCDTYFDLIILAFRWESGHIYHQAFYSLPDQISDIEAVYAMLYGWNVKKQGVNAPLGDGDAVQEMRYFVRNMIFVYLIRNEFSIARQPMDLRFSSETQTRNVTEEWNRQLGSKQKYGELYTWAMLVPYLQAILLYLLAMAYPFACIMIVVPGWHKTIITWASFYLWTKLWDLGFAIVGSIEKSLWAMLGNSSRIAHTWDRLVNMEFFGQVNVICCDPTDPDATCDPGTVEAVLTTQPENCPIPDVHIMDWTNNPFQLGSEYSFVDNVRIWDIGMTLSPNVDIDLQNVYYIYIMAALYMAVPAVTGQLVLGAKAGAASMVNSAVGGSAQEAGRAAGAGYQGDIIQRVKSNAATIGQTASAKSFRGSGLAGKAIGASNSSAMEGIDSSAEGIREGGFKTAEDQGLRKNEIQMKRAQEGIGAAAGAINMAQGKSWGGRSAGGGGGGGPRSGQGSETASEHTGADKAGSTSAGTNDGGVGAPDNLGGTGGNTASLGASNLTGGQKQTLNNMKAGGGKGGLGATVADSAGELVMGGVGAATTQMRAEAYQRAAQHQGLARDSAVAGAGAGARKSGFDQYGSRAGSQGEFGAGRARWHALNNYANRMGSSATALGLFAGGLDPGAKPQDMMGMAMDGMLNTYDGKSGKTKDNTRAAADFFNPQHAGTGKGHFGRTSALFGNSRAQGRDNLSQQGSLGRAYGKDHPSKHFNPANIGGSSKQAVGAFGRALKNAAGSPDSGFANTPGHATDASLKNRIAGPSNN